MTDPAGRDPIRSAGLVAPAPRWAHIVTALPCPLPTALLLWHGSVWTGPMPIVALEVGVPGEAVAWRTWVGMN